MILSIENTFLLGVTMDFVNTTLEYYNEQAASFVEGTRNVDFSALQNEFAALVKKGGRILDLGCGSGRDSKAFMEMGFRVVAVDGSPEICRLAEEYIGQQVICATFREFEPEGTFDGIWACASLLHLERNYIKEIMMKYASVLNAEGAFYVSFKYGDYSGERNGRFFTDMDENSFGAILTEIPALEVYKQYITEDVRPGRESEKWLNMFLKKGETWL